MLQAHYTTDDAIMTQLYTYMVNVTVPICRMSCMHINICVSNVSIHFLHTSLVLLSLAYLIIAHIHGVVYRHCSNVYIHASYSHTAYHTTHTHTHIQHIQPTFFGLTNVSTLPLQLCTCVYTYMCITIMSGHSPSIQYCVYIVWCSI